MHGVRQIQRASESRPTIEGAGVHLRRAFGFGQETLFDPFLMLDDFRGDDPSLYSAGFPWHPHRGIETITYMLEGEVDHADSLGNAGSIRGGDVQWMTAGSGIIHQEMPRGDERGRMGGFQLWANLPSAEKMIDPRYQGFDSGQIPVAVSPGSRIRVVCGTVGDAVGPVHGIAIQPELLDVTLEPDAAWSHHTPSGHTFFAYLFEGDAHFGIAGNSAPPGDLVTSVHGKVVLFGDGDSITARAGRSGARFLLAGGRPLREPIAWRGPVVMNTREELDLAWRELGNGTFVKAGGLRIR
jgi:redox-sensitive bicupin YhaK (pirin superfamily)